MLQKKKQKNIIEIGPQIPDNPYRLLIIGSSGSGKTNSVFNLIIHQPDTDKFFLYAKDPYEVIYQFLINKGESTGLKNFNEWILKWYGWYLKKYQRTQSK